MKITCLSDTHGKHESVGVPPSDVLIHAGDFTVDQGRKSLRDFLVWFEQQPAPRKILVAGNHDWALERWPDLARLMIKEVAPSVTYLQDSGVEIEGIKFWGSPVQPAFCNWAFNRERGADINRHWVKIPDDADVLVTHGPSSFCLDRTETGEKVGCRDLYEALLRAQPMVHCHGHIHYSYGSATIQYPSGKSTRVFNAAVCGENYRPINKPHEFEVVK